MPLSVIIPTLNAGKLLEPLLSSLESQALPPSEILVVDSSSDDGTPEKARALGARVLTIARRDFDHGGARNLAARSSAGEFMVFLTQDALPRDAEFLKNLLRPFENPRVAAAYGRQVPRPEANPLERFARNFNYPETPRIKGREDIPALGIKAFFCTNVCCAVRRDAFEAAGGFPERAILNEDMMLAARLILSGRQVAYEPSAAVVHSHDYTLWRTFERYFDIGVSLARAPWILEAARPEGEGGRYLLEAARTLWRNGEGAWLGRLGAESVFKYAGYRLGLSERFLPRALKRRLGMHKSFWDRG